MNPQISIVVPVYKVEENFLRNCIEKILEQTYSDIELILVDDGSPDKCGEICDEYAVSDKRIKVIHQINSGVSSARNTGIKNACGNWILFVDADDWLEKEACEVLALAVQKYKDCDIIQFRAYQNYAANEKKLDTSIKSDYVYSSESIDDLLFVYRNGMQTPKFRKQSIAVATSYFVWDKMYKRSFLRENEIEFPPGIKISEDKLFYLNCLLKFKTMVLINDFLYHYRANELSATHKYAEDLDDNRIRLLKVLCNVAALMDHKIEDMQEKHSDIIERDLMDFAVVAASGVIVNKYYHRASPLKPMEKWKESDKYLKNTFIDKAIHSIKFRDLTSKNKLRVGFMKLKLYRLLAVSSRLNRRGGGRTLSKK